MLTTLQQAILETLSVQSPGYLTSAEASAFVAIGIEDPQMIQTALVEMQNEGWVEFYTETETTTVIKVQRDSNGDPIVDENGAFVPITEEYEVGVDEETGIATTQIRVLTEDIEMPTDEGWVLTDKGREVLNNG